MRVGCRCSCVLEIRMDLFFGFFFFLRFRRPPRSTRVRSSAASDGYKRQQVGNEVREGGGEERTEGRGQRTEGEKGERRGEKERNSVTLKSVL